jgi:uncharacterized RDD family membrane protein YckC
VETGLIILIVLAAMLFFGLTVGTKNKLADFGNVTVGLFLLAYFFLSWGYQAAMEASKWGGSLGKMAMGLRVVRTNGLRLTFREAVIRNIIRVADLAPGFSGIVGIVTMLFSKRFQRLGDIAVDALVVYDLNSRKYRRALELHTSGRVSAGLVNGLETDPVMPAVRLLREEQEAIASYDGRMMGWTPGRQVELAEQLTPLTGKSQAEAVKALRGMAKWLRES